MTEAIAPQMPLETTPHNAAYDSALTRGPAQLFERLAEPLVWHIYGPLNKRNHALAVVTANLTLTAPRLAEPVLGQRYINKLQTGHRWRAFGYLLGKTLLKTLDGMDGPVVRAIDGATLVGAGFDAGTDMLGTFDDGMRIKQAHRELGIDSFATEAVIDARMLVDAGAIVIGGVGNTVAAKLAEKTGAEIAQRDQPKANAAAKLKFGLSAAADATLLLGTIPNKPETRTKFKRAGMALMLGSVVAGGVSLLKYASSAQRNARLAFGDRTYCNTAHPLEHVHDLGEGRWQVVAPEPASTQAPAISTNATRRGIEGDVR